MSPGTPRSGVAGCCCSHSFQRRHAPCHQILSGGAAHGQTRLASRQGLAPARVKPYNRQTLGTLNMTPEPFRQIEERYHAAREGSANERAALLAQADPELRREVEIAPDRAGRRRISRSACNPECSTPAFRIRLSPDWLRARVWDHTVTKACSARAARARSFGPSTRE